MFIALIPAAPALAGEDDTPPPTDTQPVAPQPVPTSPAPTTPTPPTPALAPAPPKPKPHKVKKRKQVQVLATTTSPVTTITTARSHIGTVAQGGIQAGQGGMAQHGSDGALLGVGAGLAAFGIAAGAQARRRRAFER